MNTILTSLITFIQNLPEDVGDLRELREDLSSDLVLVREAGLLPGTVRVVVGGALVLRTPEVDGVRGEGLLVGADTAEGLTVQGLRPGAGLVAVGRGLGGHREGGAVELRLLHAVPALGQLQRAHPTVVPQQLSDLLLLQQLDGEHALGLGGDLSPGHHQVHGRHPVPVADVDVVLLVGEDCSHQVDVSGSLASVVQG